MSRERSSDSRCATGTSGEGARGFDARSGLLRTFRQHPIAALLLTQASVFTGLNVVHEIGAWFGSGLLDHSNLDLLVYSVGWAVGIFVALRCLPRRKRK